MTRQIEVHSPTSLSARIGCSRATCLAAIASKKIRIEDSSTAGSRKIYRIPTDEIQRFKDGLIRELSARIARVESDPRRREQALGSALAAMRGNSDAGAEILSPASLAERLGCGQELAGWLLQKYAERTENGFRVSSATMKKIIAERDALNQSGPRRASGV